jgi:hypothetical protein
MTTFQNGEVLWMENNGGRVVVAYLGSGGTNHSVVLAADGSMCRIQDAHLIDQERVETLHQFKVKDGKQLDTVEYVGRPYPAWHTVETFHIATLVSTIRRWQNYLVDGVISYGG